MAKIKNFQEYEQLAKEAMEFFYSEKYEISLKLFLSLADYNPDNLKIHEMLTYNYLKLDEVEKSKKEFDIFLKLSKEQKNISLSIPSFEDMIEDIGDQDSINNEYQLVLEKNTNELKLEDTKKVFNMGFLHMSKGNYKEAEKIFKHFKKQLSSI